MGDLQRCGKALRADGTARDGWGPLTHSVVVFCCDADRRARSKASLEPGSGSAAQPPILPTLLSPLICHSVIYLSALISPAESESPVVCAFFHPIISLISVLSVQHCLILIARTSLLSCAQIQSDRSCLACLACLRVWRVCVSGVSGVSGVSLFVLLDRSATPS